MNIIFDFTFFNQIKVIIFSVNNLKCKSVIFKLSGIKNKIILIANLLKENFENIIVKDKASNIIVGDK